MLPSAIIRDGMKSLEISDGLFQGQGTYSGHYDFFSPSPLFPDEPDQGFGKDNLLGEKAIGEGGSLYGKGIDIEL